MGFSGFVGATAFAFFGLASFVLTGGRFGDFGGVALLLLISRTASSLSDTIVLLSDTSSGSFDGSSAGTFAT